MIDLVAIVVISLLLVPLVMFTSGALRIFLSLAFVLFFPGYTLIAALFPRRKSLDGIERLTLSFGLSIALVPLIGLVLNVTPWGIRLYPILISLLVFIVIVSAIAWFRRRRVVFPVERFEPSLRWLFSLVDRSRPGRGPWDRVLTLFLVGAMIGAVGTLGYTIANPKEGEKFTEFYILGPGGKAEGYPEEFIMKGGKVLVVKYGYSPGIPRVQDEGKVIVGVINRERQTTAYKIEVMIDREKVWGADSVTLQDNERWEQKVTLIPLKIGLSQEVEFLLYRGADTGPYLTLHLLIDVTERG